jgi:AAHS family 4-hydroxybenzoate transporter-like MFS transporter
VTAPTRASIDVGRLLDDGRWGRYQKWLVFLTALTIVFDGFDNQLLGVALPTIMQDWGVPRGAFAPVVALGYLGMMIGGSLGGLAGDRFGRKSALLGCMATFGIATMAVAFVDDVSSLAGLRLLAGVGLGGAMPNAAALAAEYVPLRQRPFAVTLAIVCVPVGASLAGLAAIVALPLVGWRGMFVAGGVLPVVAAIVLVKLLPESPRYLTRHPGRRQELARLLRRMGLDAPADAEFTDRTGNTGQVASFTTIFEPGWRADTFALWGAFFSCLLAVYLGFSWLPTILTGAGLGPAVAASGLTAFNLGGVVGALAGGRLLMRFGSRVTMVTMAIGAVGGALVLSTMDISAGAAVTPIIAMLAITGGLINAVQTTMYALAAHVYPTFVRATGVGTAVAFGRSGAILTGYAGPWALEYRGSESFFWLMAGALAVTCVALAVVRRHVPARQPGPAE